LPSESAPAPRPPERVRPGREDLSLQKIQDVPDGGSIRIRAGGALVLVGNDHEGDAEDYIRDQPDLSEGKSTVKKGGAFNKGSFQVEKTSTSNQQAVKEALNGMSKNEVTFS
jgi:hypothetical protein